MTLAGVALLGAEPVPGVCGDGRRAKTGCMRVAAQRVAHENDVVTRWRQPPVGLVRDADRGQLPAGVQRQGPREVDELCLDDADGALGSLRGRRSHRGIISPGGSIISKSDCRNPLGLAQW